MFFKFFITVLSTQFPQAETPIHHKIKVFMRRVRQKPQFVNFRKKHGNCDRNAEAPAITFPFSQHLPSFVANGGNRDNGENRANRKNM